MDALESYAEQISSLIEHQISPSGRLLVALAGPPGSGKSTLAEYLVTLLNRRHSRPDFSALVPMDGFHLDIEQLRPLGLVHRRGAPDTFDQQSLAKLLRKIRAHTGAVRFPLFDRVSEQALTDAGVLHSDVQVVVVEGNYLLLDQPGWRELKELFDVSVFLDVSLETLEKRLMARWLDLDFSLENATTKVQGNDLLNARLVLNKSLSADLVLTETETPQPTG